MAFATEIKAPKANPAGGKEPDASFSAVTAIETAVLFFMATIEANVGRLLTRSSDGGGVLVPAQNDDMSPTADTSSMLMTGVTKAYSPKLSPARVESQPEAHSVGLSSIK
jgi:hypothetical protein